MVAQFSTGILAHFSISIYTQGCFALPKGYSTLLKFYFTPPKFYSATLKFYATLPE